MNITEEEKTYSQKEGNKNRDVLVFCDYCGIESYSHCYRKNLFIKCPNCAEKLHIMDATESEYQLYDVEYLAKYRYLTREQRFWHNKKKKAWLEEQQQKD